MENWENTCNPTGWGPPANFVGKEFEGLPFVGVSKTEKLGKYFDFFAAPTAVPGAAAKRRGKEPAPSAPKEDDMGFVIVESKAAAKAKKKGAATYTRKQPPPPQTHNNRPPTHKPPERRAQPKGRWYPPLYVPKVLREPSVILSKEWELVTEFTKQKMEKLYFSAGEGTEILRTGTINQYNEKYDYVTPRQPIPLKLDENIGLYNWISTIENTFVEIIQTQKELNVFASDAVIATLMTAPLSVYPWDISVEKRGGKIILDYNEHRIFDYTTVHESALIPPEEDPKKKEGSVNGPKKLSWEATMSNHYFSQQVLLPKTEYTLGKDPGFMVPEGKEKPKKGYVYKVWELDKDIKLCVRCQVDSYLKSHKTEPKEEEKKTENISLINLRAVNEYYQGKRQMNWKQAFETNRSLLISEVSTKDAIKLTKWTIEALLSGVKDIRVAYLTRKKLDDNKKHDIIGVSRFTTKEMENLVNLNFGYTWGVLKMLIKSIHDQEDGSYYLVKDPNRFIIRLYKKVKLPEDELEY